MEQYDSDCVVNVYAADGNPDLLLIGPQGNERPDAGCKLEFGGEGQAPAPTDVVVVTPTSQFA